MRPKTRTTKSSCLSHPGAVFSSATNAGHRQEETLRNAEMKPTRTAQICRKSRRSLPRMTSHQANPTTCMQLTFTELPQSETRSSGSSRARRRRTAGALTASGMGLSIMCDLFARYLARPAANDGSLDTTTRRPCANGANAKTTHAGSLHRWLVTLCAPDQSQLSTPCPAIEAIFIKFQAVCANSERNRFCAVAIHHRCNS